MEENWKTGLLEDLCNLVVSVCAKFEGCAVKTVGGVWLLRVTGFFARRGLISNLGKWFILELTWNSLEYRS